MADNDKLVLKRVISKYEDNYCHLKVARETEYRFILTYNGKKSYPC